MAENLKISLKLDTPEVKVQANVPTIIDGNINSQPKINFVSVGQRGSVGPAGPAGTITAEQQAAINANTAKVGITNEQANAITVNTSKVGITTEQADAISANTSKVSITSSQASAIVANTAKNSYPDADSTKLAGIQAGAEVNVQANWNETDSNADSFIQNKPTIPTDTNTTYTVSCVDGDNSDEEKIRLTDSNGTNDDIVLEAGTGLSIARSGDKITFTNTVTDTDTVLTTEQVQDIVGAMFTSNTETRISATYQDDDGTIDLVVDDMTADTNTQLTTEEVQDIVGGMLTGNTETRISVTYDDSDGTIDFVVNDIPVDLTVSGDGTIHVDNVPTLNQSTTGNAATATLATNAQGITGAADGDVTITSDGEVTVKLDSDNDEALQKFKVTDNSDAVVFSVDEGGAIFTSAGTISNTGSDNDLAIQSDGSMTFTIDRDNDETSQSFSFNNFNVEIANLDESGNLQIDGDLTVSGNDIKDSGGNSIISSDGSGVVTMAGGNIAVGGSNANLNMNAGSDIVLEADQNGGGGDSTIQYPDSGGTNRIMLAADTDVVILSNRASNGTVQIRANTATAGGSGEVTVVTVQDTQVDISKDLNVTGIITGKQREIYSQSFLDDLGTTKHFLPWKDINEQTTVYQEEAAMVMPCDGRIVSVTVRMASITGDGNMTIGIETIAPNINQFGSANWTSEETESLAVTASDDYHVFHFAFDNAKHFDSGDLVSLSIQNDADISGTTYFYVSTVVEYDWNTFLGTTSAEHDSNP